MLRIIGADNCGRCKTVLNLLTVKGVTYEYVKLLDLPQEEQKTLMDKAKKKKQLSLPLIEKGGELFTLQEVIE